MTLYEFDKKIDELKIVRSKAEGIRRSRVNSVIEKLEMKRLENITESLRNMETTITAEDLTDLTNIADTFENSAQEIQNVNNLIDNSIGIGKRILALL
tara:strand:+ start:677 stop:970 length:294 start_codon:yes stop_codon:yes gene_type:complete